MQQLKDDFIEGFNEYGGMFYGWYYKRSEADAHLFSYDYIKDQLKKYNIPYRLYLYPGNDNYYVINLIRQTEH